MKTTIAPLSSVSKMKYNIEKKSLIDNLSRLENTVRRKFNVRPSARLKDIECYYSQCNFLFAYHEVIFLCE